MRARALVLSLCMLATGTINTIATKYQDIIVVGHQPDGTPITFKHPAVQSACMFLGECLCLIPYFFVRWRRQRAKRANPAYVPMAEHEKRSRRIKRIMAFALPALCDATGTTFMNVGLYYTYASTYQMLRGTLVLFAGMFTIIILRRQLYIHHWLGMVLITAGAALVGASSVIYSGSNGGGHHHHHHGPGDPVHAHAWNDFSMTGASTLDSSMGGGLGRSSMAQSRLLRSFGDSSASAVRSGGLLGWMYPGFAALLRGEAQVAAAPLFGDVLVVCAQMFTALQFILEEKFLVKYKVPTLLAVGIEGCWGVVLCLVVLPILSVIRANDGLPVDDAIGAMKQIAGNRQLALAVGISVLSIAFFNFFGVSVTKSLSGAARAAIDACRTLFIWLYCVRVGWESFHGLEVLGFAVLIAGSSLYNEILKSCLPGTSSEPVNPRRRRSERSAPNAPIDGDSNGDARVPLMLPGEHAADGPAASEPVPTPRTAAPTDVPQHPRTPSHMQASVGSGSDWYTMARSMRLGVNALSPHSLDSGLMEAEGDMSDGATGSYISQGTPLLGSSAEPRSLLMSYGSETRLQGLSPPGNGGDTPSGGLPPTGRGRQGRRDSRS